ncbi:MAG TPA: DUF4136 domain-containing protein, partial [Blastocatellia bacterium]|nr:DUF4136 domain-containing protein [Blastocatellia bacterium]
MHRMPTDPIGENPIWDERIRRAIEQHLTEAGFQRVVEGAPDFLVSYYLGIKERYDVRYLDYGFPGFWGHWGGWGGWGPGIGTVNVWKIPYTESTLVIDIIDPSTNQLIWRGYDTETIDFNKSEKTINNSVEDLIKRLVHDLKEAEKKREKK